MGNKFTYDEVKENINNLGYELLSEEYINNQSKLILKDNDGYLYYAPLVELGRFRPNIVSKYNPYTIQNIKLWGKLNNKMFELISDTYINNKSELIWKCSKEECGEIFKIRWTDIQRGQGCPFCRGLQVSLSNCLATKNSEVANQWHPTLNGKLTPYDVTARSGKKVWWHCQECRHEWKAIIASRNDGRRCPECNKSKGEARIKEWLELNNVQSEPQKEFDGLVGVGGGNLSYDFFLPQYNILIEYQGEFHDGTVSYQTEKQFKKQQEHDKRKFQYAKQNNIKLLEIWYWDFDNIEKILEEELIDNSSFLVDFINKRGEFNCQQTLER